MQVQFDSLTHWFNQIDKELHINKPIKAFSFASDSLKLTLLRPPPAHQASNSWLEIPVHYHQLGREEVLICSSHLYLKWLLLLLLQLREMCKRSSTLPWTENARKRNKTFNLTLEHSIRQIPKRSNKKRKEKTPMNISHEIK